MTTQIPQRIEAATPLTTCTVPFSQFNCAGDTLFSVRAGIPHDDALEQASCLLSIALNSLGRVAQDHDSETAAGAKHLVEMAKALVDAVTNSKYHSKPAHAEPAASADDESPMDDAAAREMIERATQAMHANLSKGGEREPATPQTAE
jgi:hypothetical protein